MFDRSTESLVDDGRCLGELYLISWDAETFGFPVADFQLSEARRDALRSEDEIGLIQEKLERWATSCDVRVIGSTVPAGDLERIDTLQRLGFNYVDTTLLLSYQKVQRNTYDTLGFQLQPATSDHLDPVRSIARTAFRHGRYHADPRFPKALADERYAIWAERAFAPDSGQQLLVSLEESHGVTGFVVLEQNGQRGVMHLLAVDPEYGSPLLGAGLCAAALGVFKEYGVRGVRTSVSTANIAALALHNSLGARPTEANVLFSQHLI